MIPTRLALLTLVALAACARAEGQGREDAAFLTGGSPDRGAAMIRRYGCGSCHTVEGVTGANSLVGPPLVGIGQRAYIAGVLPNSPQNLIRWIQHPREVDDKTAMPDLGVTTEDARDIAAYLYSIR